MKAENKLNSDVQQSSISIWLNSYNDIYSDFDHRSFHERSLSDDFIHEALKIVKETPAGIIKLQLLMPQERRNAETEVIIVKSLHQHFRRIANNNIKDKQNNKLRGIIMTIIGLSLMVLTAYLANQEDQFFLLKSLRVMIEPAGWFLLWTGLDLLYNTFYKANPELEFNQRMTHARIEFLSH